VDQDALETMPFVVLDRSVTGELAVDDDTPALIAQEEPDVLGRGLESAVPGGNAVGPERGRRRSRHHRRAS
jgi:hypothetical protein